MIVKAFLGVACFFALLFSMLALSNTLELEKGRADCYRTGTIPLTVMCDGPRVQEEEAKTNG